MSLVTTGFLSVLVLEMGLGHIYDYLEAALFGLNWLELSAMIGALLYFHLWRSIAIGVGGRIWRQAHGRPTNDRQSSTAWSLVRLQDRVAEPPNSTSIYSPYRKGEKGRERKKERRKERKKERKKRREKSNYTIARHKTTKPATSRLPLGPDAGIGHLAGLPVDGLDLLVDVVAA